MNVTQHIGTHPQPVGYYVRLFGSTFRTMLSIGMLVLGSGLLGLAVAVLLDGFDLVEIGLGLSIGETLGTFIVVGVVAAFAFGIATEGRYGAVVLTDRYPTLEVVIGRIVGGILVAVIVGIASGQIESIVVDQNLPFRAGHEMIRATGVAGYVASIVGAPAAWGLRRSLVRAGFDVAVELPALYAIWAVVALIVFSMPAA